VMLYIRFPLSLQNGEDMLHKRSIEISHETVRFWWTGSVRCSPPKLDRRVDRVLAYKPWLRYRRRLIPP
jgi:putative transposase